MAETCRLYSNRLRKHLVRPELDSSPGFPSTRQGCKPSTAHLWNFRTTKDAAFELQALKSLLPVEDYPISTAGNIAEVLAEVLS